MRKIILFTDPIIREISLDVKKVTNKIKDLIFDMTDILKSVEGSGLSAVQVGELLKVIVIRTDDNEFVPLINPKIIEISNVFLNSSEGCLSIPRVYGVVERPAHVTVHYLNERGKKTTTMFCKGEGVIVLHEFDHLYGRLFIDRFFNRVQRRHFQRRYKFQVRKIDKDYYDSG